MGDFNIDLLKSESCDFANKFTEQLFTSSFYPLITKPTRITSHTATLIDNIFTNNIDKIDSSINGILFSDISDHLPIIHKHFLNTLRPNEDTGEKYYTIKIILGFLQMKLKMYVGKKRFLAITQTSFLTNFPHYSQLVMINIFQLKE
jgi:hypothetical protein